MERIKMEQAEITSKSSVLQSVERGAVLVIGGQLIRKERILEIAEDYYEDNFAITKHSIFNTFGIEDTPFARKVLTKLLSIMLKEGSLKLVPLIDEETGKLCGKGYVPKRMYDADCK